MKLLVLLSRFPYPLEKGDKLRAYHQIKELAKQHEIHLVCLTDQNIKDEWVIEVKKICKELHVFKLNWALIYWNTAKQFFTDKPFQVGYFYQRTIQKKINSLIVEIKPDHIYCQLIRTAEYVKNIQHIKKTIDYMDALGKGMFRRSEISTGIKKRLFKMEAKRLSEYENRIFDYFNHHTIISEQDRKFINHAQQNDITIIENGIDESFFNFDKVVDKKYDLVFIGNMNYAPNMECAEFIVNEILPDLSLKNSSIQLLISGANPHQRILNLEGKNVTVSGWVEDIRQSYASGKIFVAPLFIGTGLQNKLLEAMAMGIPCVTTTLAKSGLGIHKNKIVLTADSKDEFVEKISALLEDENLYAELSKSAREYVQQSFSWNISVAKLNLLISSYS